ncbi:MAG TPA: nucleotidyltransferase family protein [Kofleriaceae bacterium]|nr:nucleotidyltransferase family protein [Kofleriaceae bacterium]
MKIGAVILAAGAGTRLGGVAKALLTGSDGRTFIAKVVATAREAGTDDIVVVVGPPFADAVATQARELGVRVVVNPQPERGMASSVAAGFGALDRADVGVQDVGGAMRDIGGTARDIANLAGREDPRCSVRPDDMRVDAAWLWPVDHPHVDASTLRSLISALIDHDAARPVYRGRGGHPPLIARSLFERLATCANADGGARAVLAAADTIDVPVDDRSCVRDVDTPADLEVV